MAEEDAIKKLIDSISYEKKILGEIERLFKTGVSLEDEEERKMASLQMKSLKNFLKVKNNESLKLLKGIYIAKNLPSTKAYSTSENKTETVLQKPAHHVMKKEKLGKDMELIGLEKETLKRLKKKEKVVEKDKKRKPSEFAKFANNLFSKTASKFSKKKNFQILERDLIKANLPFTITTYISMIFFATFISIFISLFLIGFFLFFNFGVQLPIITRTSEPILLRLAKTAWIILVAPLGTFFMMYIYPSLEKKSAESKIDYELPFATINMSAISGSLIDPSRIFQIIITTKEYPSLSKEFARVINEINVQGYNFVSALRSAAFNTPSKKLSELFSGLATTINSGGDLPDFFEERSKSLLFEHRLEREKQSKAAETFMDIYISVVIAAPMILMLLLMMMRISGLGISLSTATITLIMVLGVTVINIVFLTFLHLRKGD